MCLPVPANFRYSIILVSIIDLKYNDSVVQNANDCQRQYHSTYESRAPRRLRLLLACLRHLVAGHGGSGEVISRCRPNSKAEGCA